MAGSRQSSKNGKRKGKRRKIIVSLFLVFLFVLLGAATYFYYEYSQALNKAKTDTDTAVPTEEIEFNGVENPLGKVNVLLLGVDAREGEEVSRTDTIMIAQYDPETKKSKLVSLMRDSYVEIPGYKKHKLNSAFTYGGTELLRQTIYENFAIDLQYYALIDFKGFTKMIDAAFPNGIEINVEKAMSKNIGVKLKPGLQELHGKELLGYVRYRNDAQGDFGRVERQQKVIKQLTNEVVSIQGVMKLPTMIGTIQPYIFTNIERSLLLSIGTAFLSNENRNLQTLRIPQDGSYQDKRYPGAGLVLDLDIEKNKAALQDFLGK